MSISAITVAVDLTVKAGKIALDVTKKVADKVVETTGATNAPSQDQGQGQ